MGKDKDNPSGGKWGPSALRRACLCLCGDECCAQEADYTVGTTLKQFIGRYGSLPACALTPHGILIGVCRKRLSKCAENV